MIRNILGAAFCVFVSVLLSVVPSFSQSTLVLQKECSDGAAKFVQRLQGGVVKYESHYNKKLDKCFVRVGSYYGHTEEKLKAGSGKEFTMKHPQSSSSLYDVFEGTLIGIHYINGRKTEDCYVGTTRCPPPRAGDWGMIESWERLVKPYMTE